MKRIIALFLLITSISLFGIDVSSGNGDWETGSSWGKGVEPTTEDTLIIEFGDTLDITSNYSYPVPVIIIVRGAIRFSGKLNLLDGSELYTDGGTGTLITTGGGNSDKLKIDGVGYWDGSDGNLIVDTGFPLGPPLPVVWGNILYAYNEGLYAIIKFDVYSQINNDKFIIEIARDIYDWEEVAYITGAGNTSSRMIYEERVKIEFTGIIYIRIKQVDYDGEFEYSKIFTVILYNIDDDEILYYVDMYGKRYIEQPKGFSIAILRNNKARKVFNL